VPVADGGLRHLRNQSLSVEQQQVLHRTAHIEFLLDQFCADSIRMPAALHDCLIRRCQSTEEERHPEQALVSRHRDFRRRAIRHDVDERDDAGRGEIEVMQLGARCVQDVAERHGDKREMREQSLVDRFRQGGEQVVLPGRMRR